MEKRSTCPISYSLEIFGDKWTLLILRDLMFNEKCSFLEFKASAEKISSAVLTEKLNTLVEAGIVYKKTSPKNASKYLYLLTDKGVELVPMMVGLVEWGSKYSPDGGKKAWLDRIKRSKKKMITELQEELRSKRAAHLPGKVDLL